MNVEQLSNYQIVTLAVALLGGAFEHIDREDIAIKVNEMVPGKFNWRKYPNRIDLNIVRVALNDAKKIKNGKLIVGDNQRGWMLSPNGLKWITAVSERYEFENINLNALINNIFDSLKTENVRLLSTNAYKLYKQGRIDEIAKLDFYEFSRTDEYFKIKACERRFTIIDNAVLLHGELREIWKILVYKYIKENNND